MKVCTWFLETTYACGGVIVDGDDTVVGSCPIYKWMVGKDFNLCLESMGDRFVSACKLPCGLEHELWRSV